MTRKTVARSIGWLQIIIGVMLSVASITVFALYRSSLGSVSASLAESMVTVSDGLQQVVKVINERQVLIINASNAMQSARKAVADTRTLVEVQAKQLPAYAQHFKALSDTTSYLSLVLINAGRNLKVIKVPSDFQLNGWDTPTIIYTQPLAATASGITQQGQQLQSLSYSMSSMAGSLSVDGSKAANSLVDTLKSTALVLDNAHAATDALKSSDLPELVKTLNHTSDKMREAGARTANLGSLAWSLLLLGVLLSCSFVVSGIGLILTNSQRADVSSAID